MEKEEKPTPEEKPEEKPQPNPEEKPNLEETIKTLEEKVKLLEEGREQDKATIESLRTTNQELSSSVVGLKGDLAKFKEEYAEQFNRGSNDPEQPKVEPRKFTPYSKEVADMIDLISK